MMLPSKTQKSCYLNTKKKEQQDIRIVKMKTKRDWLWIFGKDLQKRPFYCDETKRIDRPN